MKVWTFHHICGITTLGVLKWFLTKEGGCATTEDISSAPWGETERASCEGIPPGPFSPLRQAIQLATSNILQSKHVLTWVVGSNPEVWAISLEWVLQGLNLHGILPTNENAWVGFSSDFSWFIIYPKDRVRSSTVWVFTCASSWDWALISQSSRYWWSLIPLVRAISFTSFTIIVKTCGAVASLKGMWTGTPVTCGKTLGT